MTSEYRSRECYAGIAELPSTSRASRGRSVGLLAMQQLIKEARNAGFWKLVSRIFVENAPSRALMQRIGFREVGIYKRHAQSRGIWRDVVIIEGLLTEP